LPQLDEFVRGHIAKARPNRGERPHLPIVRDRRPSRHSKRHDAVRQRRWSVEAQSRQHLAEKHDRVGMAEGAATSGQRTNRLRARALPKGLAHREECERGSRLTCFGASGHRRF